MAEDDARMTASDPNCLHCWLSDAIEAEDKRIDAAGEPAPRASEWTTALILNAGDLLSHAPLEMRGTLLAQAIQLLATRAGIQVVQDGTPTFPPARQVH